MTAASVLAPRRHVLLDFDGPVCSIFGGTTDKAVATALRAFVLDLGLELPPGVVDTHDPFDILRFAASRGVEVADSVERELARLEVRAVETAKDTDGAHEAIRSIVDSGRSVTIVSNNSANAIRCYLGDRGLSGLIRGISARASSDPRLLKPSPHLLIQALADLNADVDECVMIGDSLADVQAAHKIGVAAIGYANKPGKEDRFQQAAAEAVIDHMSQLAAASDRSAECR